MVSRTRMLESVRDLRWKEVEAGLAETPKLLGFRDERGRSWLHLCCGANPKGRKPRPADRVRTADVLLAAGLDLDEPAYVEDEWKATPLWYAIARARDLVLARHLLERGAEPNHCLWAASFHDDVKAIRLLVGAGADVDPVTEDETPFLAAVKTSHFRAAAALLELGADPDFRDSRGMTALHYMLKKNSDERHFGMLVRQGARGDIPNREGATAREIMSRKRSASFRRLADQLATG